VLRKKEREDETQFTTQKVGQILLVLLSFCVQEKGKTG
jgi:hypothetical protein